jgi:hypothetical protein
VRKTSITALFLVGIFLNLQTFADDSKSNNQSFEYQLFVNGNIFNGNDQTLENLYRKIGLRLSYHLPKTKFFIVGGTVKLQGFADLIETKDGKTVTVAKIEEAHHLNFTYMLWEGKSLVPGCFYLEAGITQEKFKSQDVGFGSFKKKNISAFVGASFNVKITKHSALAIEAWYINQGQIDFDSGLGGVKYAFKQNKVPITFNLVYRF